MDHIQEQLSLNEAVENVWSPEARAAAAQKRKATKKPDDLTTGKSIAHDIARDALKAAGGSKEKAAAEVKKTMDSMGATHAHQFHWRNAYDLLKK